jgi:flagellar L-ring protein precursor FlgH
MRNKVNTMQRRLFSSIAALALAALAGCAVTPSSIVVQPTSARPQPAPVASPSNGAIFQAASYRPLFEDRRARLVGDILTIAINEKTSAGKKADSSASKSGSVSAAAPVVFGGLFSSVTSRLSASAQTKNSYEEEGAVNSSNSFTGQLSVTVTEVLPNGNLMVAGEKQVALDRGSEFIRFSGVVNPATISAGNMVSSTQVADARVEYRTNAQIDKAEMMAMLTRFFLSVMPL